MSLLETLIVTGGVLHFGLLIAGALVPVVLDWRRELAPLSRFSRQLVWVHGGFIVAVIVGFGLLSLLFASQLAAGSSMARAICGFIALFWLARLVIELVLFDPRPYFKHWTLKAGERTLRCVFAYHALVYGWALLGW